MHSISEIGNNVPAFLGKLWKMIEDPETNDLISWDSDGRSFVIKDDNRFARELLPMYYKHNNWSSFVRQLNMYGFHKITSPDSGSMKTEPPDEIKFSHPCFVRGHAYLLDNIKRKIGLSKVYPTQPGENCTLNKVLADMQQMKGRQQNMDSRLTAMKLENETLWQELSRMRKKHIKQQQIVNKLIQFLISILQQNSFSVNRKYPRMLVHNKGTRLHQGNDNNAINSGPVIHELESAEALVQSCVEDEESEAPADVTDYFISQSDDDVAKIVVDVDVPDETILGVPEDTFPTNSVLKKNTIPNRARTSTQRNLQTRPKLFKLVSAKQPSKVHKSRLKVRSMTPVSQSSHQQQKPRANTILQQKIRENQQQANINLQRLGDSRHKINKSVKNQQQILIKKQPIQTAQKQLPQKRIHQPLETSHLLLIDQQQQVENQQQQQQQPQPQDTNQQPVVLEPVLILPEQTESIEPIIDIPFDCGSTYASDVIADDYSDAITDINIPVVVEVPHLEESVPVQTEEPTPAPVSEDLLLDSAAMTSFSEPTPSPIVTSPTSTDMQVACVDDRQVNGTPPLTRSAALLDEMDDHLDTVQADLDNLKELLRSEGISLDVNGLLGYFNDDLLSYNIPDTVPNEDDNTNKESSGNELMRYSPSLMDLTDLMGSEWSLPESPNEDVAAVDSFTDLNTPQFVPNSPTFPTPSKKRKK